MGILWDHIDKNYSKSQRKVNSRNQSCGTQDTCGTSLLYLQGKNSTSQPLLPWRQRSERTTAMKANVTPTQNPEEKQRCVSTTAYLGVPPLWASALESASINTCSGNWLNSQNDLRVLFPGQNDPNLQSCWGNTCGAQAGTKQPTGT